MQQNLDNQPLPTTENSSWDVEMDSKLSPEDPGGRDPAAVVATPASVDSSVSDPAKLENGTEKQAVEEAEWTLQSSLQVLGGFMMLFNSYRLKMETWLIGRWGYLNAFGVFQNYYKTVLIPESSNSQISWIGSVQGMSLFIWDVLRFSVSAVTWFRDRGKAVWCWIYENHKSYWSGVTSIYNMYDLLINGMVSIILVHFPRRYL